MHFIDFSKKKISESINFIFEYESESDELNLKINNLKNIYKSIMNDDSILKEDRMELSKFFSFFLRTKIKDWLINFLIEKILNMSNKELNSNLLTNNKEITNELILNKNKISLMCYFLNDLMQFNCTFFNIFFEIKNFDNDRIKNTVELINNSTQSIAKVFKINNLNKKKYNLEDFFCLKKNIILHKGDYCFNIIADSYFFIKKNNIIMINDVIKVFIDLFFNLQINNISLNFNSLNKNDLSIELNNLFSIYKN